LLLQRCQLLAKWHCVSLDSQKYFAVDVRELGVHVLHGLAHLHNERCGYTRHGRHASCLELLDDLAYLVDFGVNVGESARDGILLLRFGVLALLQHAFHCCPALGEAHEARLQLAYEAFQLSELGLDDGCRVPVEVVLGDANLLAEEVAH